ncbi:hypothetical protein MHEI_42620 [Mycobacterium heidelbergense]|nr:hypothetical protein MHEI_42620 [Mycobacterium heidelbergense]
MRAPNTEAIVSAQVPGSERIDVPQAPVEAIGFRAQRRSDEPPDAEPPPARRPARIGDAAA